MSEKRKCCVCGSFLDTLFERAKQNVKTCSNKCRQKRYRDRKKHPGGDARSQEFDHDSHELDEARLRRIRCFVEGCERGLNVYQVTSNKGPGGLHASPKPMFLGIDT